MRRILSVALLVLAVAVVAAAVVVVNHSDPVPQAGQAVGYSNAPLTPGPTLGSGSTGGNPSQSKLSSSSSTSTSTGTPSTSTTVAFLGDNYTAGQGASAGKSWVDVVATDLGVKASTFGVSGGGYAKRNSYGNTYASQVAALVRADPELVVVSGGRNDASDDSGTLADAANQLFQSLAAKLPNAELVAIAPWWGDSKHPSDLKAVDNAVRNAVTAAGGTYLDLSDPLVGHPEWMADDANPNNRGYAAIANSVEPAIKPYLPAAG